MCVSGRDTNNELYVGGRFGSFENNFYTFANLEIKGKEKTHKHSGESNMYWGKQEPPLYSAGDLYDLAVNDSDIQTMYVSGQFSINQTFAAIEVNGKKKVMMRVNLNNQRNSVDCAKELEKENEKKRIRKRRCIDILSLKRKREKESREKTNSIFVKRKKIF